MNSSLRIAVLDCDIPVPNVYAERNFYSDIFAALLRDAAVKTPEYTGLKLEFSSYDSMKGEEPSEEDLKLLDGIIITGSGKHLICRYLVNCRLLIVVKRLQHMIKLLGLSLLRRFAIVSQKHECVISEMKLTKGQKSIPHIPQSKSSDHASDTSSFATYYSQLLARVSSPKTLMAGNWVFIPSNYPKNLSLTSEW
jgi:hypothetical protein